MGISKVRLLAATSAAMAFAWGANAHATCTSGTWSVVAPDPNDTANANLPVQAETTHFALRFASGVASVSDATTAANYLETVWSKFIDEIGFSEPYCSTSTKYKINVYVRSDTGLQGGADGLGHPVFYMGPATFADHFGMAHEFTHSLQSQTQGMQDTPYGYSIHESHANFMATQMSDNRSDPNCSALLKKAPHEYYLSSRNMYCTFQFWEYIKKNYGYGPINDIWAKGPGLSDSSHTTADPFSVLLQVTGWNLSKLNDIFGHWATRNVKWDYIDPDGFDRGAVYRKAYGGDYSQSTDEYINSAVRLEPIDTSARQFHVPEYAAPQRWGYNIVKLRPDSGVTSVTVTFRGITQSASAVSSLPGLANEPSTIPTPGSDWRWGLVAVDSSGKARYSSLQKGAKAALTYSIKTTDQGLYLVVVATPNVMQKIRTDQPFYSIYRYPWMVQFSGAMPDGYQSNAPDPISGGHKHSNGGGWVGPDASVASTAYVGPYARVVSGTVSGNARIEDQAVILDNVQVSGSAKVGGLSVLRYDTIVKDQAVVKTNFLALGDFEHGIVLSGTAQNIGDVEQRGASFSKGVYYGFVDSDAANDAARGANLTAAVTEITAKPDFTWIP